ncbi:uncharacterized protein [Watersipora subatra]|uniref:uncharacterized protein n=1 Tax=Watersipora subatra TaxID=2589382 RepID=UPI00355B66BC
MEELMPSNADGKGLVTTNTAVIRECLKECSLQFNSITMCMTHITNILFDFVNDDVQGSRSEILPRILQLMKDISGDKMKEMTADLPRGERRILTGIADRFSECEQLIYKSMNRAMQIVALQKLLESKDKEITSLKTSENVTLWQKEKVRILKDHEEKINSLKTRISEMDREKEVLRQKLEDRNDALKTEKLRVEVTKKRSSASLPPEESDLALLEDLKRKVYLYDKDLQRAESQMGNFQSDMLGMMGGIQGEIMTAGSHTKDTLTSTQLSKLNDRIDKIKAAIAGDMDIQVVRADLSDKYLPSKSGLDFFVTRNGKKVVVQPMRVRRHDRLPNKNLPPLSKRRDSKHELAALSMKRRDSKQRRQSQIIQSEGISNPRLIDASQSTLDTLAVMKHFPTLSASYVKDQWNNFKKYDTDQNGELDMSEIMSAITGLMPGNVKPAHIEAAVREIDIDGSGTLDFYEYLQVAMLLERKKGKSELFHNPEVTQYNKQISKTCSIQ